MIALLLASYAFGPVDDMTDDFKDDTENQVQTL
jgi:hypothetical protein